MDATTTDKLEKMMTEVEAFSSDDKAKLLKKILADSSIQVTIGSSQSDAGQTHLKLS